MMPCPVAVRRFVGALAVALPTAAPAAAWAQTAAQPASTTPPALAAPKALRLPAMVERTLPNGLRLVIIPQRELPVVDVQLVIRTGSEADPAGKAGLATLTANLLDEGAGTRDALALAEEIGFLAVRLNTSAGLEQSSITLHSTRATLDSALRLMADVVLRPTFPEREFVRLRSERLTALLQEQDRGPAMADRAFAALVYGESHPYGRSTSGTRESVESITRDDVQQFWRRHYRPNNATLIVAGDLAVAEAVALATRAFGAWPRAIVPSVTYAKAPAPAGTAIHIVDKPKAAQSSFRIGGIGVARRTADYYPLMVMNTALGGSFTSRLNNTLREVKGYTYGAGSGFSMRREAGPFTARAEVVSAKTDSALIEFMRELGAIRTPMPAAELEKVKRYLRLGYADGFETPADIASQVAGLVPSGLPLATLGAFDAGIARVTAADVQRVANQYLDPSRLTIVIAGDRATIEPALKATKIAPVDVRDMHGQPVRAPNERAPDAAPMLVSTQWVAEHANDRDLVILHVGTKAQYDSGHVAGSRHVALEEISLPQVPGGLSLQMAGTEQLVAWAVRNGIGDRTRVIVVPHDFNLQSATRVFFTLAYLGAGDRVSLMDGGYQAWKQQARAVSTEAPAAAAPATFTPRLRPALIASVAEVEATALGGRAAPPGSGPAPTAGPAGEAFLVDARLTRFFNGDGGGYPRPGHIPGAVNIPISSVSVNGFFRPRAELEALFAAQQVDTSKPVITYCHIGQQATLLWFVATLLERDARMYDGSFQEWSGSTRPIVGPGEKK